MKKNTITIGRDKKCDLILPDKAITKKVSGNHATIKSIENDNGIITGYVLEDHSTNGTYVNSKFVHNGTFYIKESDVIKLGPDYVLDWGDVLPLFGIRITKENANRGFDEYIESNPNGYESPDPVYPDQLPNVDDKEPDNGDSHKKTISSEVFWCATILAAVAGFILGYLIGTIQ